MPFDFAQDSKERKGPLLEIEVYDVQKVEHHIEAQVYHVVKEVCLVED